MARTAHDKALLSGKVTESTILYVKPTQSINTLYVYLSLSDTHTVITVMASYLGDPF